MHFASYMYSFVSYLYSCKILRPYAAATVQMHSDAVLSSNENSLNSNKNSDFYKPLSLLDWISQSNNFMLA